MKTTIAKKDNQTLVKVEGRIDTVNSQQFQNDISQLLELENPDIIVDCINLEYTSSSGLRQFLVLQKSVMAHNGKLILTNMRPEIKEIFDLTGFSSIFTIK